MTDVENSKLYGNWAQDIGHKDGLKAILEPVSKILLKLNSYGIAWI